MNSLWAKQKAFTIVELLIVIVVIGILATISIVAYNGTQVRASDTKIRAASDDLEKSIRTYNVVTGKQPWVGSQSTAAVDTATMTCPGSSVASGWAGAPSYDCTLEDLLVAGNYISPKFFLSLGRNKKYPSVDGRVFMFYQCTSAVNNKYALYIYLQNPTAADDDTLTDAMNQCYPADPTGQYATFYNTYNMRAARVIQL